MSFQRHTALVLYPARAAGQGFILQQFPLLTLPAPAGQGLILHQFLLSSSFCCQHFNISETLGPILLILGQSNKYVNAHFWYDQFGVKGQDGVTEVKKVIFTKIAISSTDYMVWSCDSCILISLIPSTKVMVVKIHPGSFGVIGVKRSFSPKLLFLLQITWYGHVTHTY